MPHNPAMLMEMSMLQSFCENTPTALMVVGKGTLIQLINRETEKITGFTREEMQGELKWTDLGQLKINRRQFFVNRYMKDLQSKYRKILDNSGKEDIELIMEQGRKEEDFVIQADRIRVMDVLNSLLENAVRLTGSGRITLGYVYLEEEGENGSDVLLF